MLKIYHWIVGSKVVLQHRSRISDSMKGLNKIISGGQTGVDQAALRVAITLKIDLGGWCPPGRICEYGKIPDHFPLEDTPIERSELAPDIPRSLRTEWNVRDSDATLILKPSKLQENKGIDWTLQCIDIYRKNSLVIDPYEDDALRKLKKWLNRYKIRVLNVAGPSESTVPGIGLKSYNLLLAALRSPDN